MPVRGRAVAGIAAGWSLRTAAPKWACVWRNHPEAQCRLRTIVMPAPWNGWSDPAWQALLHQRLHEVGLEPDGPDPRLLAQAEREILARLAPPWTKLMTGQHR
ncbi:hypothetical protein SAMN05216196_101874 [Lutimaribacter pacificus]|uniref:Uncharacterized protein n=1 Tax=Lutimaribacter pacificus TaxID=391948 RepID=A0A1H0CBB1_9RHOB|nr:hypothetical protein SAMN05216196_101874 [Lutimaribacter pacificus]SHJ46611.1 hypothetical protein SAMN05444142_101343 [Lutimaribacter pacificus]